ncbi:hypothetical protein FPZ42_06850 [Mucilaginibacter achroorhodeus]|uniref:TonB-dependent receptor n=1 Tax=Mucilaginibacter achroorhodeus TaxID=2599294 RepID=A0A563U5X2_9SPHI|nr:hypothetical protein [Mucilaginibacter achroorhodeus]TWR26750.1 hypothetical protein FPZ42_06850 [Mucilaginibacter achroorhodeus]
MILGRILSLIVLLFSTLALSAQQKAYINGVVKDSIGSPVEGVSISISTFSGIGIGFARTNEKGGFDITYENDGDRKLFIKFNALGYKPQTLPIPEAAAALTITLRRSATALQEVVVRSNNKITVSKDTLKYNVKAFKDQNDRVIADLIARLPGLQVDEKGGISYNGKRISNVYIDGDNLLDGNYRLATGKVPVNSVEQVQVIEHDQPIKALSGYITADDVSLNLKLTDSARITTINNGSAGIGNKVYTGELTNLIFQKKIKTINSLKGNNNGENLQDDNENFQSSFNSNEVSLKSALPYLSMATEVLPTVDERYYLMNHDLSGNVNALLKTGRDWSWRINAASIQLKRNFNYRNSVNYFLANSDTIRYEELQDQTEKLDHWKVQLQAEKNTSSVYLRSVTKLDLPKWSRIGRTAQNAVSFDQQQPNNYLSLGNETALVKAVAKDQVLQYNSIVQYYKNSEQLSISPGVQQNFLNDSIPYLLAQQGVRSTNIFIDQHASYKIKVGRWVGSVSSGASVDHDRLSSALLKMDSTRIFKPVGYRFANDLNFDQLVFYAKPSATYLTDKNSILVEARPAYTVIKYNDANALNAKSSYFLFNPLIEFRQHLNNYSELELRYKHETVFGQINDIYTGTILVNYRQLNYNAAPLPQKGMSSYSARYSYRNPLHILFYNIYFGYDRTAQNFISSYVITNGLTRSTAIPFDNKTDNYTLNTGFSKYLFFIGSQLSAQTSLSLQKGNAFYNDQITPYKNYRFNAALSAQKKLSKKMTLRLSGEFGTGTNLQRTFSDTVIRNSNSRQKFKAAYSHQLTANLSYTISYHHMAYRQSQRAVIKNDFLEIGLRFLPNKWRGYFELQGLNLLNERTYQQIISTTNQLSVFEMPLRPRTLMIKYFFSF